MRGPWRRSRKKNRFRKVGLWKHHATRAELIDVHVGAVDVTPPSVISPVTRAPGMVRRSWLRQRRKVDLPQPGRTDEGGHCEMS
jgi:hypothetical protein